MKKSGFADWNTTTFTDGSASSSVISAPNSTIVVGTNMLIGALLNVTVHRPGWVRSVSNCEGSGMTRLLRRLADHFFALDGSSVGPQTMSAGLFRRFATHAATGNPPAPPQRIISAAP